MIKKDVCTNTVIKEPDAEAMNLRDSSQIIGKIYWGRNFQSGRAFRVGWRVFSLFKIEMK